MALTSEKLKSLEPPPGWQWQARPTLLVKGVIRLAALEPGQSWKPDRYSKDMKALHAWAVKNALGLIPHDANYFSFDYDERSAWNSYQVKANAPLQTKYWFGEWNCTRCEAEGINDSKCTNGDLKCRNGHKLKCGGCGQTGSKTATIKRAAGGTIALCHSCAPPCKTASCKNRCFTREQAAGSATGLCIDCSPVFNCTTCQGWAPKANSQVVKIGDNEHEVCGSCAEKYSCFECGTYAPRKLSLDAQGKKICASCKTIALDKERVQHEKFDKDELPSNGSLVVESLPSRPFRTISIETEVDGDKNILAGVLHRAGIVRTGEVEGYHAFPELDSSWSAFLKHDGSVSGGELISWCMNLDEKPQADALLHTMSKLRSLHKIGKVQYNANCGGHIHIDAHNFGIGDVWRLMTGWNYLEDVIYRLAGAGHSYGHRTLVQGHDRANAGGGYAGKPVKGPFGTKGQLNRSVAAQVRMSGLNFKPYFAALGLCRCTRGYNYDSDGRHCDCNLGKCTIEWRVWNSQANPRILHAWIAFMQALTAWADQGIDPDPQFETDHPAHEYNYKKFATCAATFKTTTKDRLRWIFKNLTFTESERNSLIYAFQQSELSEFDDAFWKELATIVPEEQFPVKSAPRNPAKRSCAIAIKPLTGRAKVPVARAARPPAIQDFVNVWQQAAVNAGGF